MDWVWVSTDGCWVGGWGLGLVFKSDKCGVDMRGVIGWAASG